MRRVRIGALTTAVVVLFLALVPTPASANVSAPGGGSVEAGRATSFTARFEPRGTVACPSVSGGGTGVTVSIEGENNCEGPDPFSRRVNITTDASAVGQYTITVEDTADGGTANFVLTVRPAPTTTTTSTTTTTAPTTTLLPTTTAPPTTLLPPPTTAPPTTVASAAPNSFASIESLVSQGMPEEGMFFPLVGTGYADCFPLRAACGDSESGMLLVPARQTQLAWSAVPAGSTPPPSLQVRTVLPLQPVGQAPSDQPSSVNYQLNMLDLADQGQLKSLTRGLNPAGELVAPTSDLPVVSAAATGVDLPESRAFIASQPFDKPYRLRTQSLSEAAPAIPIFSGTQNRVLYGVRAQPGWNLGREVIPLLGNGRVPYVVRAATGPPGLLLAIPPGVSLDSAPARVSTTAPPEDEESGGAPIVPIAIAAVVVAAVGAGSALYRRRRASAGV